MTFWPVGKNMSAQNVQFRQAALFASKDKINGLTCSFLKKDIKFSKGGHEFVFFEMWDERPHTQYQLSMIRFYLPLNQLILWPSESQTCQNWAQLLKGSLSTNFTYLGEIISIFVYIFRFCWESWLISTFDLHFGHFYNWTRTAIGPELQ